MMQKQEIDLEGIPFFKGLNDAQMKVLAGCASQASFEAGSYLFKEGDDANQFYALRYGRVAVEIAVPARDPIVIQTLEEGDILGWSWVVPPYKKQFSARAVELTRCYAFDAACLRRKCEEDSVFGYALAKRITQVLGQRLQATRLQLLDLYGSTR